MLMSNMSGFTCVFVQEAKNLHLHKMQHAIKCEICDYKCQQHSALNWHMKAKHGIDRTTGEYPGQGAMTYVSSDDDVSDGERVSLRVIPAPPSGPVFPGMSSSPVMRRRTGPSPVDLSVKKTDELCAEDGVIEITPVSPG